MRTTAGGGERSSPGGGGRTTRRDGTVIAGDWMKVTNNTFLGSIVRAVAIRGVPRQQAEIHHNWFFHESAAKAVRSLGNTRLYQNACGLDRPRVDPGEGSPGRAGKAAPHGRK